MRVALLLLIACDAGMSPAPVAPVTPPAPTSSSRDAGSDRFAACMALPQPAKPGHNSVEPDDMICIHGDTPYSCPPQFDGAALGCHAGTQRYPVGGSLWCCPAAE